MGLATPASPPPLRGARMASKVPQYEAFLNEVLKADLEKAASLKARLQAEVQEWDDLAANLRVLQQAGQHDMKALVDVGSEVLCEAHVPDASRLFISIGLGFHVEATLEEAPRIIAMRKAALQAKVHGASEQCARIRAHIRLVEQALGELQAITPG